MRNAEQTENYLNIVRKEIYWIQASNSATLTHFCIEKNSP
jgi:hypothetical protein